MNTRKFKRGDTVQVLMPGEAPTLGVVGWVSADRSKVWVKRYYAKDSDVFHSESSQIQPLDRELIAL